MKTLAFITLWSLHFLFKTKLSVTCFFVCFVANHGKWTLNTIIAQKELLKKDSDKCWPIIAFWLSHVLSHSHSPNWLTPMKPKQPQISAKTLPHINTYFSQCLKTAEDTSQVPAWAYLNVNELLIIHFEIIFLHNHYRVKKTYSFFYFCPSVQSFCLSALTHPAQKIKIFKWQK